MTTVKVNPAMDNDAMEEERLPVQSVSFTQFTQGTSFHGVNYIFKPGATPIRRLAWVMAFLVCSTLFSYQVITRVQDYYDYPSNVNVEVIYDTELAFPAVTFCNQNSYRAYATTQLDMQNVIIEKYSVGGARSMKNVVREGLNLTYPEFVRTTAHQIEDMLQLCSWANQGCRAENLTQTITDFGVCYTFNGGNTSLTLDDYGSENGLTLVLNIEMYEHMAGPHNDIGIKVLLHDPEEFPLMKGQGFTIGSGQHVLMAIHMSKTESLSHPYGKCSDDAQPRSYCRLQCEADKMIEKYGCHDAYIPETLNASYCSVKTAMSKNLKGLKAKCTCDVPCIRTRYAADLSYADISAEFSLNFWVRRQEDAFIATSKYIQATEYIHRHFHGIMKPTITQFEAFTVAFDNLLSIAADIDGYLTNTLSGNAKGRAITIDTVISGDLGTIQELYEKKREVLTGSRHGHIDGDIQALTSDLQDLLQIIEKGMDGNGVMASQLVTSLDSCNNTNGSVTPLTVSIDTTEVLASIGNWREKFVEETLRVYSHAYGDVMNETDVINRHESCFDYMSTLQKQTINVTQTILNLTNDYEVSGSCEEALGIAQQMFQTFILLHEVITHNITNYIPQVCYKDNYTLDWKEISRNPIMELTQQPLREISTNLNIYWIKNLAEPLTFYLDNEDARKYDLYRTLTSEPYTFTMLDMQDKFAGYLLDIRTRNNGLQTYFDDVIDSFTEVYNSLPLPVITSNIWTKDLQMLKFVDADENFQNDSAILNLVQEVRNNGPDAVTSLCHLLQNISSQYQNYLQQETDKMETLIQHISVTMTDIKSDLQKFGDMAAVVVDKSNFIQLDIFYEELSYSRIKQQESFPFISLLSEIGGFLGLLLGASVLTVCEILDFTILAVMNRINMVKVGAKK